MTLLTRFRAYGENRSVNYDDITRRMNAIDLQGVASLKAHFRGYPLTDWIKSNYLYLEGIDFKALRYYRSRIWMTITGVNTA